MSTCRNLLQLVPTRARRQQLAIMYILGLGCVVEDVTIAEGSTIGAGSVVTKKIPPPSVSAGVPAKVIKYKDV